MWFEAGQATVKLLAVLYDGVRWNRRVAMSRIGGAVKKARPCFEGVTKGGTRKSGLGEKIEGIFDTESWTIKLWWGGY